MNALVTETRQALSSALAEPALRVLPFSGAQSPQAVAIHDGVLPHFSELRLSNRAGSTGLAVLEHRYFLLQPIASRP